MPDKRNKTLSEIQQTQAALRESIENAKELAEKSERLIRQHRKEITAEEQAEDTSAPNIEDLPGSAIGIEGAPPTPPMSSGGVPNFPIRSVLLQ